MGNTGETESNWGSANNQAGPILRCKLKVERVVHVKGDTGETTSEEVTLRAVYGKEGSANAQWSKWTPNATFTITINNPSAFSQLASGHEFFVDFTPADMPVPAVA